MTPDELARLHKFEDVFAGPTGIVGERATSLHDAEAEHRQTAINQWTIWIRTLDSFFDFSIHTLSQANSQPSPLLSACFVSSFWRLRSSYTLLLNGYYEDASALLRAVWENVRHMAAARGGAIRFEAIWDLAPDFAAMPPEAQRKHRKSQRSKFEQAIEDYHAAKLDASQWKALKQAYEVTHSDVHRSELAMVALISTFHKGDGMRLFPAYDREASSRVANLTVFLLWAMARLLHHFYDGRLPSGDWEKRFRALDEHFAWQVSGFGSVLPHLEVCFKHYMERVLPL